MPRWERCTAIYTAEDMNVFDKAKNNSDPTLIDRHFGAHPEQPFENIFASALDENGKAKTPIQRQHFANFLAFRYIKSCQPDATIWSGRGRYRFAENPDDQWSSAEHEFIELFGKDRAKRIAELARKAGLDPEKGTGLPDLAVYFPTEDDWRFIELKIPEKGDTLSLKQEDWLDLIATHLGPASAVEWVWRQG